MLDDTPTRVLISTMLLVIFVGLGMTYFALFHGGIPLTGIDFDAELREEGGLTDAESRAEAPDFGFDPETPVYTLNEDELDELLNHQKRYVQSEMSDPERQVTACLQRMFLVSELAETHPSEICDPNFYDCVLETGVHDPETIEEYEISDERAEEAASLYEPGRPTPSDLTACSAKVGDFAVAEVEAQTQFRRIFDELDSVDDIEQFDCQQLPPLQRYRRRAPTAAKLLDDCPALIDGSSSDSR